MDNNAENKRKKYDDVCSDMISRLPESVLLHILCFLSYKKAVQTSVLSKSWRHLGPTRPVIVLLDYCEKLHVKGINRVCENCFDGIKKAFISVADNTFQRYHDQNLFPKELRLDVCDLDMQSISSVLEKWIPIFINPDNPVAVTSLRLSFGGRLNFNLPSVVFKVESLQNLCLRGCILDEIDSMDNLLLKNLKILSLSQVEISEEALEKVISGCPLLERLVLSSCRNIKTIIINGNKNHCLNYCEFSYCYYGYPNEATSIEIDAPTTLESICIEFCSWNWYLINNNNFPHLKSLFLSDVTLSTELFHNFSCKFPRLQELSILDCYGLEEINLSSFSIKRLIIHERRRSSLKKVAIEVPNILYFKLSNNFLPTTVSLATTSDREWKSHLKLHHCLYDFENDVLPRILKLFGIVKAVSQSQISLSLLEILDFKMNQIEWDFNDHPVVVQHLDLNIRNKLRLDSLGHFLNVLFRIFRPEYMEVESGDSDKEVTELLWKTLIHEREKTEYEHLEEVSIEASDKKGEEWHHVKYLTCLPELTNDLKIRFRFKWRDGLPS